MKQVDIRNIVIPSRSRSGNYPTGSAATSGGGSSTIINQGGSVDLTQARKEFLSKKTADEAAGIINFRQGVKILNSLINLLIQENTEAEFTDNAIVSAARLAKELKGLGEGFDDKYLRKDQEDETQYLLRLLGGIITDNIQSQDFTSGPFGTGLIIKRDPKTGKSYIEADEIYIRLKAYFDSLEIKHLAHVGGRIVLSPASMKCIKVEKISGETDPLYDVNGERLYDSLNSELFAEIEGEANVYRCYFKTTDGEKTIYNEFDIDDFAQCREFNVKTNVSQHVSNQYYWRRVVGLGEDYIDLSIADCDTGSMEPKAGDEIVTIGNKTKPNRQHVIFLSSYDDDAPCFKLYSGINDYTMLDKEVTVISPNAEKNVFMGKVVVKPGSSGFGNFVDGIDPEDIDKQVSDAVLAAQEAQQSANDAEGAVNDLNEYVDGAFSDGIIEKSEAQAIEKYINQVNSTRDEVTATYNTLYQNPFLQGEAKTNLLNAKVTFLGAIDNLINSINTAIADGKATSTEKADVDAKFDSFSIAYASMSQAIEQANQSIQEQIKIEAGEYAIEKTQSQIQAVSDQAKDDLAKQMGYINGYSDMVKAAERGETVIAGGRINTQLIEAEAIVTTALIASAIMAKTLNINNNFVVDTQGNVTLEGNAVIGGNGVFRGAIETTLYDISNELDGSGTYILKNHLHVIARKDCYIILPISIDFASKRVMIVSNYVRSRQSIGTIIKAEFDQPLYGLNLAEEDIAVDKYVKAITIYNGTVELLAVPSKDGLNVVWMVTNRSAETEFLVVSDDHVVPGITEYTVSTSVSPTDAGTVSGGGTQIKGYIGQLTATPNKGYVFNRWSTGSTDNPTSVTWDADKSIIAYFVEGITDPAVLTINVSPEGSGTVTGAGTYEKGTQVTMVATANSGYYFSRWSDGDTNISKSYTVNEDKTFTAYFAEDEAPTGENILLYNDNRYYSILQDDSGECTFKFFLLYPIITVNPSFNGCAVALDKGYLAGKIKAGKQYSLEFRIGTGKGSTSNIYQYGCITYIGKISEYGIDSISSQSEAMFSIEDEFDAAPLRSMTFTAERTTTSEDAFVIAITKKDTITNELATIVIADLNLIEL